MSSLREGVNFIGETYPFFSDSPLPYPLRRRKRKSFFIKFFKSWKLYFSKITSDNFSNTDTSDGDSTTRGHEATVGMWCPELTTINVNIYLIVPYGQVLNKIGSFKSEEKYVYLQHILNIHFRTDYFFKKNFYATQNSLFSVYDNTILYIRLLGDLAGKLGSPSLHELNLRPEKGGCSWKLLVLK